MTTEKKGEGIASQLSNLKEVLGAITDMMPDRHLIVDENGMILSRFGNMQSEQFYELEHDEPRSINELTTPENAKKSFTALNQCLATQKMVCFEVSSDLNEVKKLRPHTGGPDEKQWFEIRIQPLDFLIADKKILIASIRNITDKKKSELELRELVVTDPLTQLFNRRYATEELTRCLQRFSRYKTDISVLMLDIDFFKSINDNYGHDIGDLVLIELSKFLKQNIRNVDTIARIGGEEFLIIMPDVALQNVQSFLERLLNNIEKLQITTEKHSLSITVSGGLTQLNAADTDIETILKRADVALYRSKNEGRNRITIA